MALHDDLLEQASHLAQREPRRPRQASLRRAVSSAYYALFHRLAADGARYLAPPQPTLLRLQVRRAFVHHEMKEVCKQFAANSPIKATSQLIEVPLEPPLRQVAQAFVDLQDARHEADYDLSATFERIDVLRKVRLAHDAFSAWQTIRTSPNAAVFLAALLLQRQWR